MEVEQKLPPTQTVTRRFFLQHYHDYHKSRSRLLHLACWRVYDLICWFHRSAAHLFIVGTSTICADR